MTERVPEDDLALISAATVLLARDTSAGPEVLMLKRNSTIAFGGAWVFPGGRVEAGDGPDDELARARRAAARECEEEAGLRLAETELTTWSHWQPPLTAVVPRVGPRRRFSTWFFIARAPEGEVIVDGGEIHEYQWLTPRAAIDRHRQGQIELVAPTWVTLWQLAGHDTVEAAVQWAASQVPPRFHTRPLPTEPLTLTWEPDVYHAGGGPDDPGPRHRLLLDPQGWVYERSF